MPDVDDVTVRFKGDAAAITAQLQTLTNKVKENKLVWDQLSQTWKSNAFNADLARAALAKLEGNSKDVAAAAKQLMVAHEKEAEAAKKVADAEAEASQSISLTDRISVGALGSITRRITAMALLYATYRMLKEGITEYATIEGSVGQPARDLESTFTNMGIVLRQASSDIGIFGKALSSASEYWKTLAENTPMIEAQNKARTEMGKIILEQTVAEWQEIEAQRRATAGTIDANQVMDAAIKNSKLLTTEKMLEALAIASASTGHDDHAIAVARNIIAEKGNLATMADHERLAEALATKEQRLNDAILEVAASTVEQGKAEHYANLAVQMRTASIEAVTIALKKQSTAQQYLTSLTEKKANAELTRGSPDDAMSRIRQTAFSSGQGTTLEGTQSLIRSLESVKGGDEGERARLQRHLEDQAERQAREQASPEAISRASAESVMPFLPGGQVAGGYGGPFGGRSQIITPGGQAFGSDTGAYGLRQPVATQPTVSQGAVFNVGDIIIQGSDNPRETAKQVREELLRLEAFQ